MGFIGGLCQRQNSNCQDQFSVYYIYIYIPSVIGELVGRCFVYYTRSRFYFLRYIFADIFARVGPIIIRNGKAGHVFNGKRVLIKRNHLSRDDGGAFAIVQKKKKNKMSTIDKI